MAQMRRGDSKKKLCKWVNTGRGCLICIYNNNTCIKQFIKVKKKVPRSILGSLLDFGDSSKKKLPTATVFKYST